MKGFLAMVLIVWSVPPLRATVATDASVLSVFLEKVENCGSDRNILVVDSVKVYRWNRTTLGIKGNLNLKEEFEEDTMFFIHIYTMSNKRWNKAALFKVKENLCKFIKEDKLIWPKVKAFSQLPDQCPFPKGIYRIDNAGLQLKDLPAFLPHGCYKLEMLTKSGRVTLSCLSISFKLAGPNATPNPRCV